MDRRYTSFKVSATKEELGFGINKMYDCETLFLYAFCVHGLDCAKSKVNQFIADADPAVRRSLLELISNTLRQLVTEMVLQIPPAYRDVEANTQHILPM